MMVKRFYYLCCLLLFGPSCGQNPEESIIQGKPAPAPVDSATASISITLDGNRIAAYESHNANAVLDSDVLMIEMNSPDSKYSLMGYVGGSRSGKYVLAQRQQRGKASISIYHDGNGIPASLTPTEGQFSLIAMNGKSCSGNFSGSLKDQEGKTYTIRGYFSRVAVRNIQAGK
ncbi:hypothetical protein [Pseudoflavitalea rhizosphaerae]|uniref:hypothetical protein n=1 Tax=Pseudoflavitalea rhizosphaerae TaxID=1884793 RepID=UPI000F8EE985|nr:hypothetical protein [Pseudoflavitalea rhizosphaerae]